MENEKNAKGYVERILAGNKIDNITREIEKINRYEKMWIKNSLNKQGMIKEEFSSGKETTDKLGNLNNNF